MDVAYANPFIVSTIETFKKMLNIEGKTGKVALKVNNSYSYDVSGVIGLSGEAQGAICLSFPKEVALKAVSALLGMEIKEMGPDVSDGIGELVNIVAGNAKQYLTKYSLSISLPKVIIGKDLVLAPTKGVPTLVVPFISSLGEFAIEISLKTPEAK